MKREFKDCPKCGEKDGIVTTTTQNDLFIEKRIYKCDTCPYQPKLGL